MLRLLTMGGVDLVDPSGGDVRPLVSQPKRLALLIYLASSGSSGAHRRDALVARFWPELDHPHARAALRQAVHVLRAILGAEANATVGEQVALVPGAVSCDAVAFEAMLAEGRAAEALALYRGDFLAGFFVSRAAGAFDEWVERRRAELRGRALSAAWRLAREARRQGAEDVAVHWLRWILTLSPDDEAALRELLLLLDGAGNRTAAIGTYRDFALRVRAELDVEPSAETQALVRAIRVRGATPAS